MLLRALAQLSDVVAVHGHTLLWIVSESASSGFSGSETGLVGVGGIAVGSAVVGITGTYFRNRQRDADRRLRAADEATKLHHRMLEDLVQMVEIGRPPDPLVTLAVLQGATAEVRLAYNRVVGRIEVGRREPIGPESSAEIPAPVLDSHTLSLLPEMDRLLDAMRMAEDPRRSGGAPRASKAP